MKRLSSGYEMFIPVWVLVLAALLFVAVGVGAYLFYKAASFLADCIGYPLK